MLKEIYLELPSLWGSDPSEYMNCMRISRGRHNRSHTEGEETEEKQEVSM